MVVCGDGAWLSKHLTSSEFIPLQTPQQGSHLVSCLSPVQCLVEHLDSWCGGRRSVAVCVLWCIVFICFSLYVFVCLVIVGVFVCHHHFIIISTSPKKSLNFLHNLIQYIHENVCVKKVTTVKPHHLHQPVIVVLSFLPCPSMTASSPFFITPLSNLPVTTVPLPGEGGGGVGIDRGVVVGLLVIWCLMIRWWG